MKKELDENPKPDYLLIWETIKTWEKIISKQKESKEEDQDKFLFQILVGLVKKFGTDDPAWNCSAEQLLNTIFGLKQVKAYKWAELFLHGLLKKLSSDHQDVIQEIEDEIKDRKEIEIDEKMFDKDLNFNENMLT